MVEYTKQETRLVLGSDHRNTNHQFYLRSQDGGSGVDGFLIEKANVPTAQALDEFEITAATYFSSNRPERSLVNLQPETSPEPPPEIISNSSNPKRTSP